MHCGSAKWLSRIEKEKCRVQNRFFLNPKEIIRISCIVEKCWKTAFHLIVVRKRSSLVVSVLAFSSRGHGLDPRGRREKFSLTEHAFLSIICRDDTR